MLLMGVDMGTSGCKAVVFDSSWNVVCEAYREYELSFPGDGLLEIDAEVVWQNIRDVIIEANGKSGGMVEALAVSAIGDVIIPLDGSGIPVRHAIIDFDPRGTVQIERFTNAFGVDKFYNITGMPPLFLGSLAKMLWLKEEEPWVWDKVGRWATFEDFIVGRLGLEPCVSDSEAARTMLFDIRKRAWAPEVLEAASVSEDQLPKTIRSGQVLGRLDEKVAESLGFKRAVTVASGGHDMVCAAVGAGLDERHGDTAVDISGTIEGIVAAMAEPNTGSVMLENLFPCYPAYDGYVTFSVNLTAGCVVRWYRDALAREQYDRSTAAGENFYQQMLDSIDIEQPGPLMLLPHFSSSGNPWFNPNSKGMLYGLTLDSSKEDIARAIIEGLCYELKLHSDAFEKAGIHLKALRAVGGGARIDRQLQLKANITGLKIIKGNVVESSALGAAAYAGVAMGVLEHPSEAYKAIAANERVFEPDAEAGKRFEKSFARYQEFSRVINDLES
jgi:xylulokinase